MKRVVLSMTGTVLGLVALLSFKSHGHPMATAGASYTSQGHVQPLQSALDQAGIK